MINLPLHPLPDAGHCPADVELWRLEISHLPDELARMSTWLSAAELLRAARYRMPADRARFVATRYALRYLLGQRLGRHPAALRFATCARGKPRLAGSSTLSFNVSHAGTQALIGISSQRKVGVDIERLDPAFDWRSIVDLVCSAQEQQAINHAPVAQQHDYFLRCWTAKEALVKALGTGIGDGLTEIGVDPRASEAQQASAPLAGEQAAVAALRFYWLTELDGYVGCVAFGPATGQGGATEIEHRQVVL